MYIMLSLLTFNDIYVNTLSNSRRVMCQVNLSILMFLCNHLQQKESFKGLKFLGENEQSLAVFEVN